MSESFDVVIVGGGVYGCAVAWEVAGQGASVVVLERDRIASGASGGLGKRGVRANGRDPRELPLMRLGYDIWPALADRLGGPTGYQRTGHLELYERERDLPIARARARSQTGIGIATQALERGALLALEPEVAPGMDTALHAPLDGVADHTATTRSYADAARARGAQIREAQAVARLTREAGRITGVELGNRDRISARHAVVVTANHATAELLESSVGLELPIWPILPQVMRTDPLPEPLVRGLVGHAHRVLSVKPLPDGSVMISGGWRGRWNDALGRGEATTDQVEGNWAEALAVFPRLDGSRIAEVSAERLESSCIDGVPIIDRVAEAPNVFFACGWCGHGWAIAPVVARLLSEWVMTGNRPSLLAPFSHDRFRY